MFRFWARRASTPIISGAGHILRLPQISDFPEWKAVREASYNHLQPWEPSWGPDDLTRQAFRLRIERNEHEYSNGSAIPLFIFSKQEGALLGGITIGQIRRGAAQCCMIGYWMGEQYAGQGHMRASLTLVIHHIFERLQLHRIEAACIPDNERSLALLEKAGFQREGALREYLKINGRWRDHVLLSLLASEYKMLKKDNKA
ncbi:GNAT family N-acetyltransferase [Rhizobium sp. L1K21]|nr:GNAT family protein [Rhizobium sp. L1K21]MCO6186822.1 GNAT family N-acetyltransferase [Rhizobium sp. L1K21]